MLRIFISPFLCTSKIQKKPLFIRVSRLFEEAANNLSSNLAAANAKVTLNGVKNINGFTAVYSDRTDRAFQLQYDSGEIASIAFNNTGIWYDFYDGQNWKQVWKFYNPT